ncbi:DNA replication ATP-dependent helicase/nuclease [Sergentomyia squamirostris]
MDPLKKRRVVVEEDQGVPVDVSSWTWDEWNYEEDKENVTVNTGSRNPEQQSSERSFDLTRWRRCEVKSVIRLPREVRVTLMQDDVPPDQAETGLLILYQTWMETELKPLDVVSVKAIWSEELQCHIINMQMGLLVVNPNVLVSGSTLLGSLYCSRKGILNEYFKRIGPDVQIMTVGSMVHDLLQTCLRNDFRSKEEIQKALHEQLLSHRSVFQTHAAAMETEKIHREMGTFVPKIYAFIQRYLHNIYVPHFDKKDNFMGTIESIRDIEENIWLPQMGLKGKVDVSVRVRKKMANGVEVVKTLPLELKTGRATFSPEHRGQLTLYQMMMSELYEDTESGLLLYLREGVFREIQPSWNEVRDLVMMRNKYVGYLACEKIYLDEGESEFLLPEPISHPTACSTCPMNTICATFMMRSQQKAELSPSHPYHRVLETTIRHLPEQHIDYFIDWVHIVLYENFHEHETFGHDRIWLKTPEAREAEGFTLANMVLKSSPCIQGSRFVTFFEVGSKKDCLTAGFSLGDYLIVSTSRRIAVAAGTVLSIESDNISLSLERDLHALYPNETFHIDRYESNMRMTFDLTNLGALLENTDDNNRLRGIIVEKTLPMYMDYPESCVASREDFLNLNNDQFNAMLKCVQLSEYTLIEGLPGTGKTETIISLVRYFHSIDYTVLITSHTNAAVDNFLERLLPFGIPFMRLGSAARISPALQTHTEAHLTRDCSSVEELQKVYDQHPIVGVTCMGSNHPLLAQKRFNACIVDEATQVFQATIIRPLLAAYKFILVGDPHQLPPLMKSDQAMELGGGESLFKRLQRPEVVASLRMQYRMNSTITNVANNLSYNGVLICANRTVSNKVIQYSPEAKFSKEICPAPWIYSILRTELNYAFTYVNTGDTLARHIDFAKQLKVDSFNKIEVNFMVDSYPNTNVQHHSMNICEGAICLYLVRALSELGIQCKDIGIIAPFRAQVTLLQQIIVKFNEIFGIPPEQSVEVNTVDQYQGREKSVIIYSCVTNCNNRDNICPVDQRIMGSAERFAVALTRAKHKCIVIGNTSSLECLDTFNNLRRGMRPEAFIDLTNDRMGFDWATILRHFYDVYKQNNLLLDKPIFAINPFTVQDC